MFCQAFMMWIPLFASCKIKREREYNVGNRPVTFMHTEGDVTTRITCTYNAMRRRATKSEKQRRNHAAQALPLSRLPPDSSLQPGKRRLPQPVAHPVGFAPPHRHTPAFHPKRRHMVHLRQGFHENIGKVFGSNGYINTIYTYTPYGEVTSSGSTVQPFQWSIELHDAELRLVYYNYRYYNPLNGKLICRDFIDDVGGNKLYDYVNNNTISLFDYLGLQIDWHHRVPQEIKEDLAKDIDSREYGYHTDSKYHTGKGGTHPSGWNKEWTEWSSKRNPFQ